MLEVVLTLPDHLVEDVEEFGLFKPHNMTFILKAEIRRRKSDRFFTMLDQLNLKSGR